MLERTHSIKVIKRLIHGAQEVVLDKEWCMLDEYQLVDGEAKDFKFTNPWKVNA